MSSWTSRLRQASFRGVPFGAIDDDGVQGRRLAIHEYPGRDLPFVEDLGAAAGRIRLTGFLLENSAVYGGGDVVAQRDRMRSAAAQAGSALFVHPTRGPVLVNLLTFTSAEKWDEQRFFALQFEFVEAGGAGVLSTLLDTASAVLDASDAATSLLSSLFGADADGYVGTSGLTGGTGAVASLFSTSALSLSGGVGGVFGLGSTSGSAALSGALATFSSASAGLGLVTGAGAATAAATTGAIQALSASSDPGSAMDSMDALAGDFRDGDDGE